MSPGGTVHANQYPRRRSTRIPDFDYSQPGAYFFTIVVQGRRTIFGQIRDGRMQANDRGRAVHAAWNWLGDAYRTLVSLDAFVVMPNHVHGVILIHDADGRRKPLGQLIAAFKARAHSLIVPRLFATRGSLWQRGYFEHVVRSDAALERIRRYIEFNPAMWEEDQENPVFTARARS